MKAAKKRVTRGATVLRSFDHLFQEGVARLKGKAWPNEKYLDDPVGFVREVLHEEPMTHQIAILEAARDNVKTAVCSGQRIGKSKLVIWLALWWYCTRSRARVFMVAAVAGQVDRVLWTELGATMRTARRCKACRLLAPRETEICPHGLEIVEPMAKNPATGIVSGDGRDIKGFTVRDIEAMAGLAGDVLFIVDEASHMLKPIAEAIEGNLSGGGHMIWISNPTRTAGPFFDVFNNPDIRKGWATFQISSEDIANRNAAAGIVVPYLITQAKVEEWAAEKGRESPFFQMRVLGKFLRNETGRIFAVGDIETGHLLWPDAPDNDGGRCTVGVDPAGPGHGGDRTGFCVTRGRKVLWLEAVYGLTEEAIILKTRALVEMFRRGDETPWVIIDAEGPIGASLGGALHNISEALLAKRPAEAFNFLGVKSSHYAKRQPLQYERVREELWASGVQWLREGGALIPDHELETELHAPMWIGTVKGLLKVTPKDELRDQLGRSTDKADAFLLSVWSPTSYAPEVPHIQHDAPQGVPADYGGGSHGVLDPHAFSHRPGGGFNPYQR